MWSDFILGVISGSAATLVGFGFTMAWDLWKIRHEDKRRGRAILRAVKHELEENGEIANANLKLLNEESAYLSKREHLLVLLQPFKPGVWDLLKANLPDELLAQTDLLVELRDMSFGVSHLNEGIASRQTFKDTSGAMSNFSETLTNRNGLLNSEIQQFMAKREKVLQLFKQRIGEI